MLSRSVGRPAARLRVSSLLITDLISPRMLNERSLVRSSNSVFLFSSVDTETELYIDKRARVLIRVHLCAFEDGFSISASQRVMNK